MGASGSKDARSTMENSTSRTRRNSIKTGTVRRVLRTRSSSTSSSSDRTTTTKEYDPVFAGATIGTARTMKRMRSRQFDRTPSSSVASGTTSKAKRHHRMECLFPMLSSLSDDVIIYILSFVSSVPLEDPPSMRDNTTMEVKRLIQDYLNQSAPSTSSKILLRSPERFGTLTHVLPLVCKRFHALTFSDVLWREALLRLCVQTNGLCSRERLERVSRDHRWGLPRPSDSHENESSESRAKDIAAYGQTTDGRQRIEGEITQEELILSLCGMASGRKALQPAQSDPAILTTTPTAPSYTLYRHLSNESLSTHTGPVFYMPTNAVQLGKNFSLHLFEPRYRLMIGDIMSGRPRRETAGMRIISEPKPKFVFATGAALEEGSGGFIVNVLRCRLHPNGRADVQLRAVTRVVMEELWLKDGCAGLREATVRRVELKNQVFS